MSLSKKQFIIFIVACFFVGAVLGGINRFTSVDIPVPIMIAVVVIGMSTSAGVGIHEKKTKDK